MTQTTRPADYRLVARNTSADHIGSIHDDTSAHKFGYAGGLVPGIVLYGYMTHVLAETWGEDWILRGTMQSRSIRPAYEGEPVTIVVVDSNETNGLRTIKFEVLREGSPKPLAIGEGSLPAERVVVPDPATYPILPMPEPPPLASVGSIPVGHQMGTTERLLTQEDLDLYLSNISESYDYYRENKIFPPSFMQHLTTRVERDNFVYETPTIYVAGAAQHFGPIRVGDVIRCPGVTTGFHEHKRNHYVDVDMLVFAGDQVVGRVTRDSIYHARDNQD